MPSLEQDARTQMMSEPISPSNLDCRACGACCAPQLADAFYVGVSEADVARMTRRWRERHVAEGAILTKLDPVGRCVCVALRGTVGQRVSCAIYERRPDECRRFQAGSRECLEARRQAELEPASPGAAAALSGC